VFRVFRVQKWNTLPQSNLSLPEGTARVGAFKKVKGYQKSLLLRQQISFGKNMEKLPAKSGGVGHRKFLHAGSPPERVARQKDSSPAAFPDLC